MVGRFDLFDGVKFLDYRLAAILTLGLFLAAEFPATFAQGLEEAGKPSVKIEEVRPTGHGATVSYRFINALDADRVEQIRSGAEFSFKHRIEILAPRRYWLSRRKVLAEAIVETGVVFDTLTQSYSLSRMFRLKMTHKHDRSEPERYAVITDSFDRMRTWMTEFENIYVYDPSVDLPDEKLTVRIEATLGRRFVAWVFPAPVTARGEAPLEP